MTLDTLDVALRPLDRTVRGDEVARRLADAIALGLLGDGDRLPSEPELAATLQVATATVRDGLAQLREAELVRTQRGRGGGSFVIAPETTATAVLERRLAEIGVGELRDGCEHLAAIAGAGARLAARRAGEPELEHLGRMAAGVAAAGSAGQCAGVVARVHTDTAAAGQSAQLTRAVVELFGRLNPVLALAYDGAALRAAAGERLARLVGAVAAGDEAAARAAAEADLAAQFELVRARRAGRPGTPGESTAPRDGRR